MGQSFIKMTTLFENLPVHTLICDENHQVVWCSHRAAEHCPIVFEIGDCMKHRFAGQSLLWKRCETLEELDPPLRMALPYYSMKFDVEICVFAEGEKRYFIWHLFLAQDITPPVVTSNRLLPIGEVYRDGLFHIFNALTPLSHTLDRTGCFEEMALLNNISRNCHMMMKATTNLNEYLRVQNGSQTYAMEWMDVSEATASLIQQVNFLIKRKRSAIAFQSDTEQVWLYLDHYKLMIVLLNLLDNALAHSLEEGPPDVSVSQSETMVTITVKDSGNGMQDHIKHQAFTPFFSEGEDAEAHLGLGLYLAKQLVEDMGGHLILSSTRHEGTTIAMQFLRGEAHGPVHNKGLYNAMVDQWILNRISPLYAYMAKYGDIRLF